MSFDATYVVGFPGYSILASSARKSGKTRSHEIENCNFYLVDSTKETTCFLFFRQRDLVLRFIEESRLPKNASVVPIASLEELNQLVLQLETVLHLRVGMRINPGPQLQGLLLPPGAFPLVVRNFSPAWTRSHDN